MKFPWYVWVILVIIGVVIFNIATCRGGNPSNPTGGQQTTNTPQDVKVNVKINLPEFLGKTSNDIENIIGKPVTKYSVKGNEFGNLPSGGTYTEYDTDKKRYIVCLLDMNDRCKEIDIYSQAGDAFPNSEVNTLAEFGIQTPTSSFKEIGNWKSWKQNGNNVEVVKNNDGSIWKIAVFQK